MSRTSRSHHGWYFTGLAPTMVELKGIFPPFLIRPYANACTMASRTSKLTTLMDRSRGQSSLFKDVSFYLVDETKDELKNTLKLNGAKREFYICDLVTHVIADNLNFPEYEQVKEAKLEVVKSSWVDACIKCDTILPSKPFSPEANSLFHGLTLCLSQIPKHDRDALWAMITYHGGICQPNLNPKCTHLVTGKASGRKFECATQHSERLKIVTPEWVTDSIKARAVSNEDEYFPADENPGTPENLKHQDNGSNVTPKKMTPKMNEGTPSTLLTPVTPTVTQGSDVKVMPSNKPFPTSPVSDPDDNEVKAGMDNKNVKSASSTALRLVSPAEANSAKKAEKSQDSTETPPQILKDFIFVFADYIEKLPEETFTTWLDVIKKHGGEVDESYSSRCTHLLCLHQQGPLYKKALSEGRKIATAHWLNEVLTKKEMFHPGRPLHFPVPFSNSVSGCKDMLISVSGYTDMDRIVVKNMISILGASYTGYFTQAHTHLVCKLPEGAKYEKAMQWGIKVVNAKWLGDMLQAGQVFPCNGSARYTKLGEEDELSLNEEYAQEMLAAWRKPAEKTVPSPESELVKAKKRKTSEPSERLQKILEPLAKQRKSEVQGEKRRVDVLFTGLTGPAVHTYSQMLRKMKGDIAKGVKNCTHLIAPKITRTVKFLSAISVVHHIVTPSWVEESFKAGYLLDEQEYSLKDPESEEYFGFKLETSMQRSRTREVFQGLKFFVTPNITPSPTPMKEIIECAGGEMSELKDDEASRSYFIECKQKKKENGYVVTCEEDRSIWEPLHKEGHEVYNVELVLSGVMKQELEWDSIGFE